MRPKIISLTMDVLSANGISTSSTPSGPGDFTLNGSLVSGGVATLDVPRHVAFTGGSDESGDTYEIIGTDRNGKVLTETLAGPDGGVVSSVKNYKTVTSISTDGAATGAITIGTDGKMDSRIVPVDSYTDNISYSVYLSSGANLTYNFKYTLSDIFATGFVEDDATYLTDQGPKTVNTDSRSAGPFRACRLEITGFTGGTITFNIVTAHK